jgi:hypothetical protein
VAMDVTMEVNSGRTGVDSLAAWLERHQGQKALQAVWCKHVR